MSDLKFAHQRHAFTHEGRTVYEWDQSIDEVNVYITPPEGLPAKALSVEIKAGSISVGIKGNPPFLAQELTMPVIADDCLWTMEDGELHLTLTKQSKGTTWPAALLGHEQLDAAAAEGEKQTIMLQRFQQEHPGFDFSGAKFNGEAPDASTFMSGLDTNTSR